MINSLTLFPKSLDQYVMSDLISKLIPALQGAKGLQSLRVSKGYLMSPGGPSTYSKVIEASWGKIDDLMAWVQTPQAQVDKDFMINNGVLMLFYEVEEM